MNVRSAYLDQTLKALSMVLITRSSLRSLEGNLVTRQVRVFFSHLVARLKFSSLESLLNSCTLMVTQSSTSPSLP